MARRVVQKVSQMPNANRRPGGPKRTRSLTWSTPKKPDLKIKPGTGLDGYKLDEIILE